MTWELWDETSGNQLGDFDSRTEAIGVAAGLIAASHDPKGLILVTLDAEDEVIGSIGGVELANEAHRLVRAVHA